MWFFRIHRKNYRSTQAEISSVCVLFQLEEKVFKFFGGRRRSGLGLGKGLGRGPKDGTGRGLRRGQED